MTDLSVYSKTKDNICLAYFGQCDEYILQLAYFRDHIEAQLKGLSVYLAAKDTAFHHLEGCRKVLSMSQLRERKPEFAVVHEILCDCDNHPVYKLLRDSNIYWLDQYYTRPPENDRCLIVAESGYPTRPLNDHETQALMSMARSRGLRPEFGDDPTGVGHVWGVESWQLWKHASYKSQEGSLLVPTGVGTDFYKRTFSRMQILDL